MKETCILAAVIWLFFLTPAKATGDSIHYLTLQDTIFLKITEHGEKLFEHVVERKQTLYSLAKFYGMKVEALKMYNPEMNTSALAVGTALQIPIPNRAIVRYKNADFRPTEFVPVVYQVQKGDTFFKIAHEHFRMPVNDLMEKNALTNHNLIPGQALEVGWMSVRGIPDSLQKNNRALMENKLKQEAQEFLQKSSTRSEMVQSGVAVWQKGSSAKSAYALHRTAKIGSTIEVRNPLGNKKIYPKVIGRIPDKAYGNDVIIVLSAPAAKMLGAKDERFYVKVIMRR